MVGFFIFWYDFNSKDKLWKKGKAQSKLKDIENSQDKILSTRKFMAVLVKGWKIWKTQDLFPHFFCIFLPKTNKNQSLEQSNAQSSF